VHKIDIHKLADEAKLNSFHYKLIGWVILILVLDGYDIAITGAALPAIMADLKIDSTQAGFLASAGAPVVLIPFILKYIPESLPLLVKLNRDAELREMVRKIAPNYPLQAQEQFLVPHEDEVETAPVSKVFQDGPKWSGRSRPTIRCRRRSSSWCRMRTRSRLHRSARCSRMAPRSAP